MPHKEETYIGDGVYVSFDGHHIQLRTQKVYTEHYIVLEPAVFNTLLFYAKKVGLLTFDFAIGAANK